MKEFLTDTLELDKFIEHSYDEDHERASKSTKSNFTLTVKEKLKKSSLFKSLTDQKSESEFASLDRIRIVVDSYLNDKSIQEICEDEGISISTFNKWKNSFTGAFEKYSEDFLRKEKLNISTKDLILRDKDIEVYNFFKQFMEVQSDFNLVLPKGERLSAYSSFDAIRNVIVLDKINDFRMINKHLEDVNSRLPNGGLLMGCFETFQSKAEKQFINKIPVINHLAAGLVFLFKRVCPKLPYIKKLYFFITKGKGRLLSKAESLGRLVSCGFDIVDYKAIEGIHYFVAKKVKDPAYDMSPSYGPFFRMRRIGKGGKIIRVFKFRTMHPYSEYLQDYILRMNGYSETGKPANDFRLVPWGKFLRKYWLDELPQLINLIKGDLKLVGCRPVSERYFQDIPEEIQELRLTQKPGCIPPYVALNRSGSVESVLEAERQYLQDKLKNPYFTDTKYFFKAIYNIIVKQKRSA